ncbi:transcription termination/antitermination protein NusG [Mesomycoplasma lagogenitalium]|uniref:Transcription termination/antitermination protein NusG n=1 Tax=Mesomycoplasma lagogenitalium TaxID=171286 RepID=A0ABY8LX27_9BACT|nr:transcription termination/antitermination protein NusG [Mesomycoplasma lagogenitalium]WGI36873.1 transcription termination/antitermination protein NusG [Mesomycoplasma lagogenitalium]
MEKENFKWYMVSTVSGKEDKVIESLNNVVKSELLDDLFEEIKIFEAPHLSQKEIEKKIKGEPFKVKKENLYKGYIFVKVLMADDVWFKIRNTQYVTGIIGSSGKGAKPTPVSERQIKKMFEAEKKVWEKFNLGIIDSPFKPNVMVKILEGSFAGEIGRVIETDDRLGESWVEIEAFGKKVPTSFSHSVLELVKEK